MRCVLQSSELVVTLNWTEMYLVLRCSLALVFVDVASVLPFPPESLQRVSRADVAERVRIVTDKTN